MTKTKIFLVLSVLVLNTVLAQKDIDLTKIDKNMTVNTVKTKGIKWYSPKDKPFRLMGFKWIHEDSIYRRLPIKVNNITIPRKVNLLADQTSGGQIHFKT